MKFLKNRGVNLNLNFQTHINLQFFHILRLFLEHLIKYFLIFVELIYTYLKFFSFDKIKYFTFQNTCFKFLYFILNSCFYNSWGKKHMDYRIIHMKMGYFEVILGDAFPKFCENFLVIKWAFLKNKIK